jgi:small-conductance mechanosensitive channel
MPDFATLQTQYAFLGYEFFGNTVWQYLTAVVVFLAVYLVLKIVKQRIIANLHKLAEKIKGDFDDLVVHVVQSVGEPFYFFVPLAISMQFIEEPVLLKTWISYAALAVVAYTVVRAVQELIGYGFEKGMKQRLIEDPRFDVSVVRLISRVAKGAVWLIAILVVLQNFGYDITALVAGLGIGGLAIAFALQSVLGDVFASFSIYLDKPFKTGDFIIVGDVLGTVEHIGVKSTRIKSLWGEEVIVPNQDLTNARVKNYKRMENRRIVFSFGVTYQTPAAKLKRIPEIVGEIIQEIKLASLDRVHWKEFGDSALVYEVMYTVKSSEYNEYMDAQQEINLQLKDRLENEGIAFAYPTQTVFLHNSAK